MTNAAPGSGSVLLRSSLIAALGGLLFDLALLTTLRFLIRQEDARAER